MPIAIVLMVAVSCVVPVWTETLRVPAGLSPTAPRSWLVPLNPGLETIPAWAIAAMALPALMVYIIVFMETHIAESVSFHPTIPILPRTILVNKLCYLRYFIALRKVV